VPEHVLFYDPKTVVIASASYRRPRSTGADPLRKRRGREQLKIASMATEWPALAQ
jgi:hypothetical protein